MMVTGWLASSHKSQSVTDFLLRATCPTCAVTRYFPFLMCQHSCGQQNMRPSCFLRKSVFPCLPPGPPHRLLRLLEGSAIRFVTKLIQVSDNSLYLLFSSYSLVGYSPHRLVALGKFSDTREPGET